MDSWLFVLPMTKPLSLNDRMHWRVKSEATKTVRDAAHVLARQAKIPRCQRIAVELHYRPARAGRRDPLNLVATLKAVEDGIVDARVVPDDTPTFVQSVMPQIHDADKVLGPALWVVVQRLA